MNDRLKQLRLLMKKQQLDAVFISSLPNIAYLTNFSGFSKEDRDAFLFITKKSQFIFTHGIYTEAVRKYIKDFALIEMKRENPVSKSLKNLISEHKISKLGYEAFDLKVAEYDRLLKFVNKKILKPTSLINNLRIVKSSDEIELIEKACALGDKTYSHILKYLRMNISEKELAFEIELYIRRNGGDPSFPTIVAFGENAAFPHHVPTDKKLKKNMFVLMDFGVRLNNYCSDMTRTIFFGKASKEQKKVYATVLEGQQKAIQQFNNLAIKKSNGVFAKKLDEVARKYIISQGFPTIPHSLGHGIGLEVHELPSLSPVVDDVLSNGMVFSIEPGIYLPAEASAKEGLPSGFGIRIEDLFAIENNKLVPLTHSPKKFREI
jgi:Xaa-Pro aminopeptidase